MGKRNFLVKVLSVAALSISTVLSLSMTGCPKALVDRIPPEDAASFSDSAMASVFADLFEKDQEKITVSDLASIECFEIMTYSETNTVTIALEGYLDCIEQDSDDYEQYVKTVDITGKVFSNYDDFKYLTGLRQFSAIYTSFPNYDFLSECKELEKFSTSANYECHDYSILASLPNLKSVSITEGSIDDLSFFSEMPGITELSLDQMICGEDMISDISFISNLTNLERFSASSGRISDISPLAGLKNLEYLNLAYNIVEDVSPIADLTSLTYIDLTQNLVKDVSPLTNYDPEKFERIILDLNSGITDWSPLDYLDGKVQGKPIEVESQTLAALLGTDNGKVLKDDLADIESVSVAFNGDGSYLVSFGYEGYVDALQTNKDTANIYKTVDLYETPEEFFELMKNFPGLLLFSTSYVDIDNFDFLYKCRSLEQFEVLGNKINADYSILEDLSSLKRIAITGSSLDDDTISFLEGLDVDELITE